MNSFLLSFGVAIVLALVAALVGPYFIDWSDYRDTIEARITEITGLDATITGDLEIRFLPTGRIDVSGLEILHDDLPFPMVIIPNLSAEFSLSAFLRGQTEILEVSFSQPIVSLPVGADGNPDFGSGPVAEIEGENIAIGAFEVTDGTLAFVDDTGRPLHTISAIAISGDAESLLGPIKMEGRFDSDGEGYEFGLGTGRMRGESVRTKLSLSSSRGKLAVDGVLSNVGDRLGITGTIAIEQNPASSRLSAVNDTDGDEFDDGSRLTQAGEEPALDFPWKLTGTIGGSIDDFLLENINLTIGSADRAVSLEGAARASLYPMRNFSAILATRRLDLDRILAGGGAVGETRPPIELVAAFNDFAARVTGLEVPVELSISADGVLLGGGLVENFGADLVLNNQTIEINRLTGRLPGGADLSVAGTYVPGAAPSLESVVRLTIDNGAAFATWAGIDRASIGPLLTPGQRINIDFEGGILVAADRISLTDTVVAIDGNIISGGFSFPLGDNPGDIDISVDFGSLDLDRYFSTDAAAFDGGGIVNRFADALLAGRDMAVRLTAEALTGGGISANGVDVNIGISGEILTIHKLEIADLSGAQIAGSGQIDNIFESANGEVHTRLQVPDVAELRPLLEGVFGMPAISDDQATALSPALIEMDISANSLENGTAVKLDLQGEFSNTNIALATAFEGQLTHLEDGLVTANLVVAEDTGQNILRQFGLRMPAADLDKIQNAASLNLSLEGRSSESLAMVASATLLNSDLEFSGSYFPGREQSVSGDLSLTSDDISPWLMLTGLPTGDDDNLSGGARAFVVASGEGVQVTAMAGRIGDNEISADLTFGSEGDLTRIDGGISANMISFPWLLSMALGGDQGYVLEDQSFWPEIPFEIDLLSAFSGNVSVEADKAMLGNGVEIESVEFMLRAADGDIWFESIVAKHGDMDINAEVEINDRDGDHAGFSMRIGLAGGDLKAYLVRPGSGAYAGGPFTLQGELSGVGRSWAGIIAGLNGGGVFHADPGYITQLAPEAFERLLAEVDQADAGFDLNEDAVKDMLIGFLEASPLAHDGTDIVFTITDGQIVARNATIEDDEMPVRASLKVDLPNMLLESQWVFAPRAVHLPDGEIAGTIPSVTRHISGPLGREETETDVTSLTGWLSVRRMEKSLADLERAQQEARDRQAIEQEALILDEDDIPEEGIEEDFSEPEGEADSSAGSSGELPSETIASEPEQPQVEPAPAPVVVAPVVPVAPAPVIEKPLDDIVQEALKDVGQSAETIPVRPDVVPLAPATELPARQLEAAPTLPPPTSLTPNELPATRSAVVPPRGIAPRRTAPVGNSRRRGPQFVGPEGEGMN